MTPALYLLLRSSEFFLTASSFRSILLRSTSASKSILSSVLWNKHDTATSEFVDSSSSMLAPEEQEAQVPLSLEEQAQQLLFREDLGDNRMSFLPLSGKVIPEYRKITQNLSGINPKVKAYHEAFASEDTSLYIQRDGLGTGDSHRSGKNFRVVECYYCHGRGHLSSECKAVRDKQGRQASSLTATVTTRKSRTQGEHSLLNVKKYGGRGLVPLFLPTESTSRMSQSRFVDSRMNDKNLIAAYPDPAMRADILQQIHKEPISMVEASPRSSGTSTTTVVAQPRKAPNESHSDAQSSSKRAKTDVFQLASISEISATAPKPRLHKAPAHSRARYQRAPSSTAIPLRTPIQIADQPFWLSGYQTSQKASASPKPATSTTAITSTASPAAGATHTTSPQENRPISDPEILRSQKQDLNTASALQNRRQPVPPSKLREAVPGHKHAMSATSESDYESDVYSDPDLRTIDYSDSETVCPDHVAKPESKFTTSDEQVAATTDRLDYDDCVSILQGAQIGVVEFDNSGKLTKGASSSLVNRETSRVSKGARPDGARWLFNITLEDAPVVEFYDSDVPLGIAAKLCAAKGIDDVEVQQAWATQIAAKAAKKCQKFRSTID